MPRRTTQSRRRSPWAIGHSNRLASPTTSSRENRPTGQTIRYTGPFPETATTCQFPRFTSTVPAWPDWHRRVSRVTSSVSAQCRAPTAAAGSFVTQYTPTVVWAAIPRQGRTPLTPSQGYFSLGGSRSPSSRSANRGTKNSFVSVVSKTRPVSPTGTTLS